MKLAQATYIALSLALISACSQSRRSLNAGTRNVEMWGPIRACAVQSGSIQSLQPMGCFSVSANITDNSFIVDVEQLNFDPAAVGYRLIGRYVDGTLVAFPEEFNTAPGGWLEAKASKNYFIEDFVELRIEQAMGTNDGINLVNVPVGQGATVVQVPLNWPELDEIN